MGRKPSKNHNLPPHMRKRVQRSGKTYYYLDSGNTPRKEIPLGDDYVLALRKYTDLHSVNKAPTATTIGDVIERYMKDAFPLLADSTKATQASDMKHVRKGFESAPIESVRPMHIRQFLNDHKDKPTTANRCKRLISTLWNHARGWGYTDAVNPCTGIEGFSLEKRMVYITDEVFNAVRNSKKASDALRDAMDLAYFTGQRPADSLNMRGKDIANGHLEINQGKTKKRLRIAITGEFAELLGRIAIRKAQHKINHDQLLMNKDGKPMTKATLRNHFVDAREDAAKNNPELKEKIEEFWFYDLRSKAADDTSDKRGEQAASDLLGHDNVKTTQKHYLRRGKIVEPTK